MSDKDKNHKKSNRLTPEEMDAAVAAHEAEECHNQQELEAAIDAHKEEKLRKQNALEDAIDAHEAEELRKQQEAEAAYDAYLEEQAQKEIERQAAINAGELEEYQEQEWVETVLDVWEEEKYRKQKAVEVAIDALEVEEHRKLIDRQQQGADGAEQPDTGSEKLSKEQVLDVLRANAERSGFEKGRISSITIENFKGIGKKITIPFKPITLLFGANSAGKSTVLQAMQVVSEMLKNQRKFYANGESLGSFFDMVHNHDLKEKITIGFKFQLGDDGIGLDDVGFIDSFYVEFKMGASWRDSKAKVFYNGAFFCEIDVGNQSLPNVVLEENHALIKRFSNIHGDGFFDDIHFNADETETDDSPFPVCFVLCCDGDLDEGSFAKGSYSSLMGKDGDPFEGEEAVLEFLKEYALKPVLYIMEELDRLRHVGPIREIPEPGLDLGQIEESDWFNGLAAWKIGIDMLKRHSSDHFVRTVNSLVWFEYALAIQGQAEFKLSPEIYASLSGRDVSEEERGKHLLQGLQEVYGDAWHYNAIRDTLILRHKKSGVIVEPSAVGTGISQVFPVIAAAIAEKAQLVAVEQPELHIHPRMQCGLGDVFIKALGRYPERTFLLETHSEHLILRLLRRIRETSEGGPDNKSLALTPDDVGVLYVHETEDGVEIKELPITPDGDFSEKWPQGFFDERAEELF
jgi:predicted ATPase